MKAEPLKGKYMSINPIAIYTKDIRSAVEYAIKKGQFHDKISKKRLSKKVVELRIKDNMYWSMIFAINYEDLNIMSGFEIYNFISNDITDVEEEDHPYQEKWVPVSNIIKKINHIKDVIRNCSWEDELGEQTLHYSDLHNLFKILESELNKPEVTQCTLSQKNKKEVRHSSH